MSIKETSHITLDSVRDLNGKAYYVVPAFGDGNCALNSFALGLMDLIKRDQLQLDVEKQTRFMQELRSKVSLATLSDRLVDYRMRKDRSDLVPHLKRFIRFIKSNNISYTDLVNYIKSETSRKQIAALHVGLAPAVRELGYKSYKKSLGAEFTDKTLEEDEKIHQDGVLVGHEILMPLANDFFKINMLIDENAAGKIHKNEKIEGAPTISVLHVGSRKSGHFDCLLPVENQDGLVRDLRQKNRVAKTEADEIFAENTRLASRMRKNIAQLPAKTVLTKNKLNELTAITMQTGTNLLHLAEIEHALVAKLETQTREFARITEDLRVAVQAKVQTTGAALNSLGLSEFEKAVINVAPATSEPESHDEALARALQNAEILDFLNRHYDTFTRSGARVSTEPVIQPRRPSAS